MQSFDILSRHQSVFGSHFLEASAGTGKTFAIEHFVVRLLLESEAPLLLEQILVVTFTKAATRELKARIHSNLASALQQLSSGHSECDYLAAILEQGAQKITQSTRRLEDALVSFDAAQIFTIHGFCYRALNEFAFEAGACLHLNDPDATEHLAVVDRAIHDFLLNKIDPSCFSAGQIAQLWRHVQKKPERLKARLASLVNQDRKIAPLASFKDSVQAFNQALQLGDNFSQANLIADWSLQAPAYKQMNNPRFALQMQHLSKILEKKECSPEEFDQLIKEKELFLHKMDKANLKVRAKLPDANALHYPGLIEQIRSQLLPPINAAKDPVAILLRLANQCRQEVQSQDICSPDDLLKQMHQNLHQTAFAEKIRGRYQAAIIDEFQDTDPIQWEIFQSLFVGKIRSVCLVGDPKQSIYAFRNADLYTYLKAKEALGQKSLKYLDTNYRSTAALIEALNGLFASKRIKGWMGLPQLGSSLDILPVKAGNQDSGGSIHFFAAEAEKTKRGKWPTDALEQKAFFPYIAQQIQNGKGQGPWSQFAILVKDRFQAQRLSEFFKIRAIPALIRKSSPLNDSEAFVTLQELIEAVCFPSDLSRLKKLLGGPLIGWSHDALCGKFEKEALRGAKEKLLLLQDELYQRGFSSFFDAFLTTQWCGSLTVEQALLSQGKLELYTDLQQLGEIITESAWSERRIAERWVAHLQEMRHASVEEDSRLKRRPCVGEDAVQILTMHMSKGLEFDVVFALGVASSSPMQNDIVVQDCIVPLEKEDPTCVQSLKELDAEKLRQLYVALTRAKKQLHIPLAFDLKQTPIAPGQASAIELYFAAANLPAFDYFHVASFLQEIPGNITLSRVELSECQPISQERTVILDGPHQAPKTFPIQPIVSYSALAKKMEADPIKKIETGHEKPTLFNMPLGAQTGLIFHSIMEKLFQHGLHFLPQQKNIAPLIAKHTANTDLHPWKEPLFERVWELLHTPLKGFSLSEIPPSQIQQEMEFLFPFETGFMKGFADLVFEWKRRYYLLDWKTNYLGPSSQDYSADNILKAMQQHDYFLQASIYTEALKRYVKLFDNRPFTECFGGVFYVFVRGPALHTTLGQKL